MSWPSQGWSLPAVPSLPEGGFPDPSKVGPGGETLGVGTLSWVGQEAGWWAYLMVDPTDLG